MKKLILLSILLIVGCRELDDCDGVKRGRAELDDCGECVRGTTGLVYNYLMDCSGKCNGNATLDECEVCDSDSTNDCVQDNCGIWGGSGGVEIFSGCYNIDATTTLNLSQSELVGGIPSEIGNLINLSELNLSYNQLTGEIPEEIGNLDKLSNLNLSSNQLTGEIPEEIGDLVNLSKIYLNHNNFSGDIPISLNNLINLETLSLGGIYNVDGNEFVQGICSLTKIEKMWIWGLNLDDNLPECIQDLSQLMSFSIGSNNLTQIPNWIYNINNLEGLYLFDNELSGSLSSSIGNLINLKELSVWGNQLIGQIPESIGNLVNLEFLYLHDNLLSGNLPSEIENLENLERLFLNGNNLSGIIFEGICTLNINWGSSGFTTTLSPYLEDLPYFNINDNNLCPPYPTCIEDYMGEQDTSECE